MVSRERTKNARNKKTSFIIIDAQSVKNSNTAHLKGYDAGKKVSGIKRHLAVDTQGLPHAVAVTAANVTDRSGALQMMLAKRDGLSNVKNVLADAGYTGEAFRNSVYQGIQATVEIAKRSELHSFKVMPKRWVVERSFSWVEKSKRLWKNCERLVSSSIAMILLSFIQILLKRFQTVSNTLH